MLLVTDVIFMTSEARLSVDGIKGVTVKTGPLRLIGQFSRDSICLYLSVLVIFDPFIISHIKPVCSRFVCRFSL